MAKSAAKSAPKTPKITTSSKPRGKGEVFRTLAEQSGVSKKQVQAIFDAMASMISMDLGKKGPGLFNVPGMMKVVVVRKPAVPAREGKNPFTGEMMMFKAKPARNVVKIRPLKALKEMV